MRFHQEDGERVGVFADAAYLFAQIEHRLDRSLERPLVQFGFAQIEGLLQGFVPGCCKVLLGFS